MEYDYIIIGGGTAGLVVASRLTEQSGGSTVLVLESGFPNQTPSVDVPGLMGSEMGKEIDWNYSVGNGESQMAWPRGKILGGSSALHFLCWSKASKQEYDSWEKMGNQGWNWETMSRCMKKAESYQQTAYTEDSRRLDHLHSSSEYGNEGPIKVSFTSYVTKLAQRWIPALESLGLQVNKAPSSGSNIGASFYPATVDPKDKTRSYSISYLQGTESRSNLKIMTGCDVDRVILSREQDSDGNFKAESVTFRRRDQNEELSVKAKKEIVLCAGSVETPAILERSGIGKKQALEKAGVNCILDLDGVGENLQDHITVSIVNELNPGIDTIDTLKSDPSFVEAQQKLRASQGNSILNASVPTMSFLKMDDFLDPEQSSELVRLAEDYLEGLQKSKSRTESPANPSLRSLEQQVKNLKEHPNQVSQMEVIGLDFFRSNIGEPEQGKTYNTFVAAPQHLLSRGSIHIQDSSPNSKPLIDPRYFQDNGFDMKIAIAGAKFLRKLATAPALQDYLEREVSPGAQVAQEEDLKDFIFKSFKTEYHPVGTASMLPREDGGVVDSNLKVYSTSNLRVCDASIIPLHLATHIQATVYGIAERLAELIKGETETD